MAERVRETEAPDGNPSVSREYDPELDFFSASFNPLKALRTPGLVPPVKNAKIYDNLAKYDSVTRGIAASRSSKLQKELEASKTEGPVRRFLPHQMPIKSEPRKRSTKNVLTAMETIEGPLTLLKKCIDKNVKVKIYTRHLKGIRGYVTGYVTLFDKHWNMCLEDVTEVWTRLKKRKVPSLNGPTPTERDLEKRPVQPPKVTIIKVDKKSETCVRKIDQLLVRGEQVAVVVVLEN